MSSSYILNTHKSLQVSCSTITSVPIIKVNIKALVLNTIGKIEIWYHSQWTILGKRKMIAWRMVLRAIDSEREHQSFSKNMG